VVLLLLFAVSFSGCGPTPVELKKFDVEHKSGFFGHELVLKNQTGRLLEDVTLTLTIVYEDRTVTTDRTWTEWSETVNRPVSIPVGSLQSAQISGKAFDSQGKSVRINAGWRWRPKPPKS
jgi:hypothetical protein